MYKDGICRVNSRLYTKTVEFQDTNYQLAQNDDKAQIFGGYCTFLNYFDSSVHVQFTFINRRADFGEFAQSIAIPHKDDDFDDIRQEYDGILKNQLARGNNGIVKAKYITFGVEADNLREAKSRLERIETDVIANFKVLGVSSRSLNGCERLEVLRAQLHPLNSGKTGEKYDFDMAEISTKDYISPPSLDFSDGKTFKISDNVCAANFLQITSPELTDRLLSDFLELNTNFTITMHIQSVEQNSAIKAVKRKISDLDAMKINEQKKAVRAGYDTDVLPSDLVTFGKEAKSLLENLQSRNEKMFRVTFIVLNTARNQRKFGNDVFAATGVAQKHNCTLKRLDWQQEQALMSSLPLGINQVEVQRGLTTSSTAIFVPFTTQELFQKGEALYYGINALSNNIIMANRKLLKNPNALFLGTPGSGKSFAAKREIVNVFLTTNDDIIILLVSKGSRQYVGSPFGFEWLSYVSSGYGWRVSPITGVKEFHRGVDIALSEGTEIIAAHAGVVDFAGWDDSYGNYIVIAGSGGIATKYAHCSSLLVTEGQTVEAGETIALVGSTGDSTGNHLHYEVLKNNRNLNPAFFALTK